MGIVATSDVILAVAIAGIAFSFLKSKVLRTAVVTIVAAAIGQVTGEWLLHAGSSGVATELTALSMWLQRSYPAVGAGAAVGGVIALISVLRAKH